MQNNDYKNQKSSSRKIIRQYFMFHNKLDLPVSSVFYPESRNIFQKLILAQIDWFHEVDIWAKIRAKFFAGKNFASFDKTFLLSSNKRGGLIVEVITK